MKEFKNYKQYFVKTETWERQNKIEALKILYKMSNKNLQNYELSWYEQEALTNRQFELFQNKDFKKLKELLKKQIEKESKKLEIEKEEAMKKYNKIAELKDIKQASIEINWTKNSGAYGYQCSAFGRVWYKNGNFETYQTERTGGCGYDKPSTAMSYFCNKLLKIVLLKHANKILKDNDKHYKFYAGEPLYYQYGVGISSYENLFKNLGYKVNCRYLQNEDIIFDIEK